MLSIIFDIIFMLQHYVCYRNRSEIKPGFAKIDTNDVESDHPSDYYKEDSPLLSKDGSKVLRKGKTAEDNSQFSVWVDKVRRFLDKI